MTHSNTTLNFFDPGDEEVFSLSRAPKSIGLSKWALRRYARDGMESVAGAIVKLEVVQMPYGLGTTVSAYRRFIARLNGKEIAPA